MRKFFMDNRKPDCKYTDLRFGRTTLCFGLRFAPAPWPALRSAEGAEPSAALAQFRLTKFAPPIEAASFLFWNYVHGLGRDGIYSVCATGRKSIFPK